MQWLHKKSPNTILTVVLGFFTVCVFLSLSIYLFFIGHSVLLLTFDDQSCYIEQDSFDLKWQHSVEKQWWIEHYQVDQGSLLLTDTYFQTFGAGTPATGTLARDDGGRYKGYVHYQINTKLPYLDWMVSSNIFAVMILPNKTLPIYQWVDDYTSIHIQPKSLSLWALFLKENCYEYYPQGDDSIRSKYANGGETKGNIRKV